MLKIRTSFSSFRPWMVKSTFVADGLTLSRVGISRTTAKSRQRKFVPSSHPGPFALVASSRKSQTKIGNLACLIFCKRMSKLCKNSAMLFHVDMIYHAKQAKRDVEKSFALR